MPRSSPGNGKKTKKKKEKRKKKKHLLRSYYVSDAILSTEDALVNQTDKVLAFMESVIKIQRCKQTRQL